MSLNAQQIQLLARIREILDRTDTVIFVGSGISRWSGLPNWYGLIEELANYVESQGLSAEIVRKELKANDLLQAASYGVDLLTKSQFAEFIRAACRIDTAHPHEIHNEIISLGPSCFITTNYDQLLEQSFSKWQTDKHFRIVANNQVVETANIIQAKASNFIFKPHGDINDSESVILSREQYRKLYKEKLHILSALETLLASRPVVFLGFSLRDLDFLYIKDRLVNIYTGGTIDHYAVMADVSEQEISYWRKNFGIHILSYTTTHFGHQALFEIFKHLRVGAKKDVGTNAHEVTSTEFTPDKILAIARYAANILHSTSVQNESHVPLRISYKGKKQFERNLSRRDTFDYWEVDRFLEIYPQNALLIGNPGAGKTYSLRRVFYKLAQDVQNRCLQKEFDLSTVILPVYLDLKLYDGDIFEMINQILPPDFSLEHLSRFGKIKFFLDSYNELPSLYIDDGKFQDDLGKLLNKFSNSSTIIASRFAEGLSGLDYPIYQIENIDYEFIEKQLGKLNFRLPSKFHREIINLLQKPLFYRLYQEQKISLTPEMTPVDIYESLIQKMSSELGNTLKTTIPLGDILKPLAFQLLSNGIETFNLSDLETSFNEYFSKNNSESINPIDVINWLITQNFIIPASKLRLSFFHQSITEYFASLMLSQKYMEAPTILDEILKFTRWDQCIYLTLSFLDEKSTVEFIRKVISVDLLLATRAAKYLEHNQNLIVFQILTIIENQPEVTKRGFSHSFSAWELSQLPVTKYHEEILYRLLEKHDVLGASAAKLLIDILGEEIKAQLVDEMFEHSDDFNYCSGIGRYIKNLFELKDLQNTFEKLKEIEIKETGDDKNFALFVGLSEASADLNRPDLFKIFENWKDCSSAQIYMICAVLREIRDHDHSWKILIEMVTSGIREAIFPLYLITEHPDKQYKINWSLFTITVMESLIENLDAEGDGYWALSCIGLVCENRIDLQKMVSEKARVSVGIKKIALLLCSSQSKEEFWKELDLLGELPPEDLETEPTFLFQNMPIDWTGNEHVLIKLLKTYNLKLIHSLMENLNNIDRKQMKQQMLLKLDREPVKWWFSWISNILSAKDEGERNWWILYRFGSVFPKHIGEETRQIILQEFNNPSSKYRTLIQDFLLAHIPNLTLESFTAEAIRYLITDLNNDQSFESFNIGAIATESFVEQYLLPLLEKEEEPLKTNLRKTLSIAGEKNNRRFVV